MKLTPTNNRHNLNRHNLVAVLALLLMTLPALAAVGPPGAVQSVASIEAAAHSYVESLLPRGSDTRVTVLPLDRRLRLAQCGSPLATQLPVGANLNARATVGVTCPGPVHWAVYVPVVVESHIAVLVLRHAVARESRLTADDVTLETRRTAGTATAYLSSVAELAGRTVRRPLPLGTALTVEMFVADTVIHRGQEVTLLASSGDIEIRAAGRALTDAPAGGRVQVQNLSSMTVVEGIVQSADVVRVAL